MGGCHSFGLRFLSLGSGCFHRGKHRRVHQHIPNRDLAHLFGDVRTTRIYASAQYAFGSRGNFSLPWPTIAGAAIALTGIVISSSLIYFCSEMLGFAEYFENKKPKTVHRIRQRLEQPAGLLFVALWAFFPFVPTDAVCYVAGTTKMNFMKFIFAVFVGELVLCSIYVFSGGFLVQNWLWPARYVAVDSKQKRVYNPRVYTAISATEG
jgi:hypothetical protein